MIVMIEHRSAQYPTARAYFDGWATLPGDPTPPPPYSELQQFAPRLRIVSTPCGHSSVWVRVLSIAPNGEIADVSAMVAWLLDAGTWCAHRRAFRAGRGSALRDIAHGLHVVYGDMFTVDEV